MAVKPRYKPTTFYVPDNDPELNRFLAAQSNVSLSMRLLMKGFLAANNGDTGIDVSVMDLGKLVRSVKLETVLPDTAESLRRAAALIANGALLEQQHALMAARGQQAPGAPAAYPPAYPAQPAPAYPPEAQAPAYRAPSAQAYEPPAPAPAYAAPAQAAPAHEPPAQAAPAYEPPAQAAPAPAAPAAPYGQAPREQAHAYPPQAPAQEPPAAHQPAVRPGNGGMDDINAMMGEMP